jgi:hypothetical protein
MAECYHADRPMDTRNVRVDTVVYVPVWRAGRVIGWGNGHVVAVEADTTTPSPGPEDWTVLVTIADGSDTVARYWPYSVMCGLCRGRDEVTCHQCRLA